MIGKELKNKSFNIYGTKWKLLYCDEIHDDSIEGTIFGLTDRINKIISVATKRLNGSNETTEEIELTKLHELLHAILFTGQYLDCCNNEPLVEWLARCIYSLKKQGVI